MDSYRARPPRVGRRRRRLHELERARSVDRVDSVQRRGRANVELAVALDASNGALREAHDATRDVARERGAADFARARPRQRPLARQGASDGHAASLGREPTRGARFVRESDVRGAVAPERFERTLVVVVARLEAHATRDAARARVLARRRASRVPRRRRRRRRRVRSARSLGVSSRHRPEPERREPRARRQPSPAPRSRAVARRVARRASRASSRVARRRASDASRVRRVAR